MAVKLRLKRMGAKQKPFYRIVAADSRTKRDGKFLENIGTYNPIKNPAEVTVNEEAALNWLNKGAIPTDTVRNILSKKGIMKKFADSKVKSAPKKETKKVEKTEEKKETAKKTTTTKKTRTAKKTTKKDDK